MAVSRIRDVKPYRLVDSYQCFKGTCSLLLQGSSEMLVPLYDTLENTVLFIIGSNQYRRRKQAVRADCMNGI